MLENAGEDMRAIAGSVPGALRIGLMPTFTRAALAPTLDDYVPQYPDVRLHIVEGYSGFLTEKVLADELDFAIVPAFEGAPGLKARLLLRDREVLISGPSGKFTPLAPLRLSDLPPLQIVVPGPDNVRRRNLEMYFQTHVVAIEAHDRDGRHDRHAGIRRALGLGDHVAGPDLRERYSRAQSGHQSEVEPQLFAEFIVITPARRTLSMAARVFLGTVRGRARGDREDADGGAETAGPAAAPGRRTPLAPIRLPGRPAVSADARARTRRSCLHSSTMRRTVGYGARSYLKKLQPVAWLTRQISATVTASPWQ